MAKFQLNYTIGRSFCILFIVLHTALMPLQAEEDEPELVEALLLLRSEDPLTSHTGFERIYRDLQPRLRSYIHRLIFDDPKIKRQDIEDIFHNTMMDIWRHRLTLPEGSPGIGYIFGIALHKKKGYLGLWRRMRSADIFESQNGSGTGNHIDPLSIIPYRPLLDFEEEEQNQDETFPVVRPDAVERVLKRIPPEKRAHVPDWIIRYVSSITIRELDEYGIKIILSRISEKKCLHRDNLIEEKTRIERLNALIEERVPDDQKVVARMRLCDGLSEPEVATLLEIPLDEIVPTYRAAFLNLFPERKELALYILHHEDQMVRDVLWYFHIEGMGDSEIANRLGTSTDKILYYLKVGAPHMDRRELLGPEKALQKIQQDRERQAWVAEKIPLIERDAVRKAMQAVVLEGLSQNDAKARCGMTADRLRKNVSIGWNYLREKFGPIPGDKIVTPEQIEAERALVEGLKPHIRDAIVLVDFEGLKITEAMERLNISMGALTGRLTKGRQQLDLLREGVSLESLHNKKKAPKTRTSIETCGENVSLRAKKLVHSLN